jgi:hypothetical protein
LRTKITALAIPACGAVLASALVVGSGAGASASETAGEAAVAEAAGGPAAAAADVPAVLVPPAGNVQVSAFAAAGVQVYQCTAGAWVFIEPAASLAGWVRRPRGPHAAVHFRGPSWQSTVDGSLVEAAAVASSPVAGSIPELLLQARRTRGDGAFGQVTYIQRLSTSGGVAPAGSCTDGATTGVPYRADYRFFAPA